jgi:TIR domain
MKLLSSIPIQNSRHSVIELLLGDLSAIPRDHAVDLLVVSAFPGNYIALPGSLFESLNKKGLSLEKMATQKEVNLVEQLGCWISKPLPSTQQHQFNFSRILCFEPRLESAVPQEVVGNIFRCINNFAFDDENNSIAMPLIGSGYQKIPVEEMLPALLETAIFWLKNDLPLDTLKLVVFNPERLQVAQDIFEKVKQQTVPVKTEETKYRAAKGGKGIAPASMPIPPPQMEQAAPQALPQRYDLFISYAHKQSEMVHSFVTSLKQQNNELQIFYDRSSIPPGGLWIKQISDAIQKADKVLIVLSPDYSNSPVCWDEFQCAKLMEYNNKKQIIQTLYLYSDTALPPMMGIYSYIDCREGDAEKLRDCLKKLLPQSA